MSKCDMRGDGQNINLVRGILNKYRIWTHYRQITTKSVNDFLASANFITSQWCKERTTLVTNIFWKDGLTFDGRKRLDTNTRVSNH